MTESRKIFRSEEDIYAYFQDDLNSYMAIKNMDSFWKEKLLGYMMGKRTLPFTYDPFFKMVFDANLYPDRLSDLLSGILGEKVEVEDVLPLEHVLYDGRSCVIMDLLVRLSNGARASVEIQKSAAGFPDQRMSCYTADNIMQEYQRAKSNANRATFTYRDVSKVYTIVIYENSPKKYHALELKGKYHHCGEVIFNTGVKLDMLAEYHIINLDIFKKSVYTETEEDEYEKLLNGWLSFLATENVEEIDGVIQRYPWLEEVYREVGARLYDPKEVVAMFSDALEILDKNSMRLYVDELNQQLEESNHKIQEMSQENRELSQERDEAVRERDEVARERDEAVRERDEQIRKLEAEIAALKNK